MSAPDAIERMRATVWLKFKLSIQRPSKAAISPAKEEMSWIQCAEEAFAHSSLQSLRIEPGVEELQVVSLCSGLVTEGLVLEQLGQKHRLLLTCDPKPSVTKLITSQSTPWKERRPEHHFNDVYDLLGSHAQCHLHGGHCEVPSSVTHKVHLLVSGFPCQPYSRQNVKRQCDGKHVNPLHPQTQQVLKCVERFAPLTCIFENVPGFMDASYETMSGEAKSPCTAFVEGLQGIGYTAAVVLLNLSEFIMAERDRLAHFCGSPFDNITYDLCFDNVGFTQNYHL